MKSPSARVHPVDRRNFHAGGSTYCMKSLGVIPIDSSARTFCIKLVTGPHFDSFILFMIVLNAIAMASVDYRFIDENYEPVSEGSWRNQAIEIAEFIFTIIFVGECAIKIIALGFFVGKNAYLRSAWNLFDFFIVIFR